MKENQKPAKVSARSGENRIGRSKDFPTKKFKKISNKSLNPSTASISDESVDFSPISEIKDENIIQDVTISNKSLNPSTASVSDESVDFSPISEITDENLIQDVTTFLLEEPSTLLEPENINNTTENGFTNCFDECEFESAKFTSVEDDITVNFLKNFKPDEVLTSHDADPRYTKLRDQIHQYVLQDLKCNRLSEDRYHTRSQSQVRSRKNQMLILLFFIWLIGLLVIVFTPEADCGLVPT